MKRDGARDDREKTNWGEESSSPNHPPPPPVYVTNS